MKKQYLWMIALIFASSLASAAPLRAGERIVRDLVTGDYTAYYWDEGENGNGGLETAVLKTATKIDPSVRSTFKIVDGWGIRYTYKIYNGNTAQQSINKFGLPKLPVNVTLLNSTPIMGSSNAVLIEFFESSMGMPNSSWSGSGVRTASMLNLSWLCKGWDTSAQHHDTARGIQAGTSLSGFSYASYDLPSILVAKLHGNTSYHQFDPLGETPPGSEIHRQMSEIVANDFVPRNVAAPLISVPTPFDPAIVLDNLRTHVATWPSKQLADATLAAQLEAELMVTANAYRANQPQVARDHIEIMLDLIRREHKDIDREDDDAHDNKRAERDSDRKATTQPIRLDRLAARVLDFDLKYVLKRMKKNDDEHETR